MTSNPPGQSSDSLPHTASLLLTSQLTKATCHLPITRATPWLLHKACWTSLSLFQPLFLCFQLWLKGLSLPFLGLHLLSLILFLHHCLLSFTVGTGCQVYSAVSDYWHPFHFESEWSCWLQVVIGLLLLLKFWLLVDSSFNVPSDAQSECKCPLCSFGRRIGHTQNTCFSLYGFPHKRTNTFHSNKVEPQFSNEKY